MSSQTTQTKFYTLEKDKSIPVFSLISAQAQIPAQEQANTDANTPEEKPQHKADRTHFSEHSKLLMMENYPNTTKKVGRDQTALTTKLPSNQKVTFLSS